MHKSTRRICSWFCDRIQPADCFAPPNEAMSSNRTSPNHALQRTAPCVTAPASTAAFPPTMQVPRRTPLSLSLGSLGVLAPLPRTKPSMTNSEAIVTSSSSGYQSLVARTAACETGASALAAWRTSFESLALPGLGHVATLAAMSGFTPVCASLSLSSAQLRSTSPARASVRLSGVILPAPQPHSAASSSAEQHSLPLAAERSAAVTFTRRFPATRQRCRKSDGTPNHALQRTAPRVTLAAPTTSLRSPPATFPQPSRRAPQSLSLGSLGDSSRLR